MANIEYLNPNGVTCCIPISTTQQTQPSLAFTDPNGVTQYVALSTTLGSGKPYIQYGGITYSVGQPPAPHEGGLRIYSDHIELCCAYNYNAFVTYCYCVCDEDFEFDLGLNPTYSTGPTGFPSVSWNSTNCTGSSPTIEQHFDCMIAYATSTQANDSWRRMKNMWNRVNACMADGCVTDPDTGGYLCTGYLLCFSSSCYWSCVCDTCWAAYANNPNWSTCGWCHGCKPIACWDREDYVSYNLNRKSGTMSFSGNNLGYCFDSCMNSYTTTYSQWFQCTDDSCGVWHKCGNICSVTAPAVCAVISGAIPSGVTVCTCNFSGIPYPTNNCLRISGSGRAFTYCAGCSGQRFAMSGTTVICNTCYTAPNNQWRFIAETDEYTCCVSGYRNSCFYVPTAHQMNDWLNVTVCINGGRWSDGSTGWYPAARVYGRYCGLTCCTTSSGVSACCCVRGVSCMNISGSKGWQEFAAPTLVHCNWS